MPILISTNPMVRNAPFVYGNDTAGPLSVSYSSMIPNLNGTPASLLTTQNGALANNGEITIDFGSNQQNVGLVGVINMTGVLGRGLFRAMGRKSTGELELAYFLLNESVSTVMLYWVGGFQQFGLQNLSQVTVAAYLVAMPNTTLVAPPPS